MNEFDLQSPTNPSKLVILFYTHPFVFLFFSLHFYIPNSTLQISCRLPSSSSRCSCVMNLFWMFRPRTAKTWVTISRDMVGSTASPMRRTSRWRKMGCLGEVLVESVPSSFPSFSPLPRTRTTLSWIGNVALVGFSSPCFLCLCFLMFFFILYLFYFPFYFLSSHSRIFLF